MLVIAYGIIKGDIIPCHHRPVAFEREDALQYDSSVSSDSIDTSSDHSSVDGYDSDYEYSYPTVTLLGHTIPINWVEYITARIWRVVISTESIMPMYCVYVKYGPTLAQSSSVIMDVPMAK
jgi:hypothetical protein